MHDELVKLHMMKLSNYRTNLYKWRTATSDSECSCENTTRR